MNKKEIVKLLGQSDFSDVYQQANEIKQEQFGDDVYARAILEFSNYCKCDCQYCGLNCYNTKTPRYRMSYEEIVKTAGEAYRAGYKTIVLQSGEDAFYTPELLGKIVTEIKKTGIAITLSIGEKPFEVYQYLKECGADRYLLKHETADPDIYQALHRKSTLENRVECLKNLKRLGYETGSGFMIGLPGQTLDTIAEDLLLLRSIPCDMAGIGPFIPHPDTPLSDHPHGSTELTKRAVAIARILMPKIHLPATTSLGVIDQGERNDVFSCGANVIMRKVTPSGYKELYKIYPSNQTETDIFTERKELEKLIFEMGRRCV